MEQMFQLLYLSFNVLCVSKMVENGTSHNWLRVGKKPFLLLYNSCYCISDGSKMLLRMARLNHCWWLECQWVPLATSRLTFLVRIFTSCPTFSTDFLRHQDLKYTPMPILLHSSQTIMLPFNDSWLDRSLPFPKMYKQQRFMSLIRY